jgi:uncharacterized protein YaaN involved in tellurite resistance
MEQALRQIMDEVVKSKPFNGDIDSVLERLNPEQQALFSQNYILERLAQSVGQGFAATAHYDHLDDSDRNRLRNAIVNLFKGTLVLARLAGVTAHDLLHKK